MKHIYLPLVLLLSLIVTSSFSQQNIALQATSAHSGGGATDFGPQNYNDGIIPSFGCSPTPCGWGWVSTNGWIEYTWPTAVRFNSVKFFNDNRTMTSCVIEYWDGSAYVNILNYSNPSAPQVDSVVFSPVTATKIRFNTIAGNANPNFREIEVYSAPTGTNDVGVTGIIQPLNFCPNTSQPIEVRIQNFGTNLITSVNINYEINGIIQGTVPYLSVLDTFGGSGSNSALVTLNPNYFFTTGAFTIKAWTSLPNNQLDTVNANDTASRNVQSALSGTFTVGGVGADYPSLQSLATALSNSGVCGPVVVNVDSASGPYIGQVVFSNILGANGVNTITINGNGSVVRHTPITTDIAVIRLSGVSYLKMNRFTVISQATTTGTGILLTGSSNYNTIENCLIDISSNASLVSTSAGIAFSGGNTSTVTPGATGSFDTIRNNRIIGGAGGGPYYGITMYGNTGGLGCSGNVIENNDIVDFGFYGIAVSNASNNLILGNNIHKPTRTSFTTFAGVILQTGGAGNRIERNRIHNPCGGNLSSTSTLYGIFASSVDAPIGNENVFANNLIYNMTGNGTLYGIYNVGSDGAHFYHNTISLDNTSATAGMTRGFFQTTTATNIALRNNVISISRGGTGAKHAVYFGTTASSIVCNNNGYYLNAAAGTQQIGFLNVGFNTLADWQLANGNAYDQNSVSGNPFYANLANNVLIPSSGSFNNIGASLPQVPLDFTGTNRSASPDPGAYEFTPANDDVGMVSIISPGLGGCGLSANTPVTIRFRNNGVNPVSSVPVGYSINGGTPVSETFVGTLNPSQDTVFTFLTTANLSAAGIYSVTAWVSVFGDQFPPNDTLNRSITSINTVSTYPYAEGFETASSGWTAGGTASSWARATPAAPIINSAGGGSFSWVTNPTGLYNANERSFVISECFNFSSLVDPSLEMKVWWNSESGWDGAQLQSSIDGGQSWQRVGIFQDPNGLNWYNGNSFTSADVGSFFNNQTGWWSGRVSSNNGSGGWVTVKNKLTGLAGQSSVRLRIAYGSDGSVQDEGFAFDDILIRDPAQADAGVTELIPPAFCAGNVQLSARIKNFGVQTLTSINVTIEVNGASIGTSVFTGSLATNADTVVSVGFFNFLNGVPYNIVAYTSQPNGVADQFTINDTLILNNQFTSLSGSYTVGGTGADFPTLQALATVITTSGVCGPVTVTVDSAAGPYLGQVNFVNVLGTSNTNTITIEGNGAVIQHTPTTTDIAIIKMDGVSYMTLRNLSIINQATSTGTGILLTNNSNFNTIENCFIDISSNTGLLSTSSGIAFSGSINSAITTGATGSFDTLRNNIITGSAGGGPYYGITLYGNTGGVGCTGNVVENNEIRDFGFYGITMSNSTNNRITGNNIHKPTRTNFTTFSGVTLFSGSSGNRVEANRIHNPAGGNLTSTSTLYGVFVSSADAPLGSENVFANNLIYNMTGNGLLYGIYNVGSDGTHFYHNTISLDNTSATAGITRGFFQTTAASNVIFSNNLVSISRGGAGAKHAIYLGTTTSTITANRNAYYLNAAAGTQDIGFYSTSFNTLANWQTANGGAYDQNSVAADPIYTNLANNILVPNSGVMNNIGSFIPSIPLDFDGVQRDTLNPDPGAYEFTSVGSDIALTSASFSRGLCYSAFDTLEFTVTNLFGGTLDFGLNPTFLTWSVSGPNTSSGFISLFSGTLAPGQDTTVVVGGVNLAGPGTYLLNAYIDANTYNLITGNDSIQDQSFTVDKLLSATPGFTMIGNTTDTVNLRASSRFFPGGGFLITEISHFRGATTGAPSGGWPSYLTADDYIEITGVPFSDLGGYKLEFWSTTANTYSGIFPSGTIIGPNGTAIIATGAFGSGPNSPANYYYLSSSTTSAASSTARGYILKDAADIIVDAVGYSGSTTTAYSFPAASGVVATDWSGSILGGGSTAGIRLQGLDLNNGTNWVVSSATSTQDPNTLNSTVPLPVPGAITGFDWLYFGASVSTNPSYTVGPYTFDGTFEYVARYNDSTCGFLYDTAIVQVMILGLEDLDQGSEVSVYPNPVIDLLEIQFPESVIDKPKTIEVADVNGKTMVLFSDSNSTNARLSLKGLHAGMYFLRIAIDGKTIQRKIIKQ